MHHCVASITFCISMIPNYLRALHRGAGWVVAGCAGALVLGAVVSVSVSAQEATASHDRSQQVSTKILGGRFYPEAAGYRVAFIETDQYRCSGSLVGTREVLTAAHCIAGGPDASGFSVFVGGKWMEVESTWYHAAFDRNKPAAVMAPYDLGMVVLKNPVVGTRPFPILRKRKVRRGSTIFIAGFGTNERADRPNRSFIDNFKIGATRVAQAIGGVFFGEHRAYGSSTCAGDSGGPATFLYRRDALAVVGVLSAGTNSVEGGRCRLKNGGRFIHVDLQSPTSRAFLSYFPNVRYAR